MEDEDPFDGEHHAWFATLLFWRPSKMSDEQMQLHFRRFDGKWSGQTLAKMAKFGATNLQLDSNWALTRPSWRCPVCLRSKSELFRLSSSGSLLAKLDRHHDHLTDTVWLRSFELFGKDWRETAATGFADRIDAIEDLLDRFRPCLICHECNAADGAAKRLIGDMDSRFSFAPVEIQAFIRPRPGSLHDVDSAIAEDIWKANKEDFQRRLKLRDSLLQALRAGQLVRHHSVGIRERGDSELQSVGALWGSFNRRYEDDERRAVLDRLHDEFLARSTSHAPSQKKRSTRVPTQTQLTEYMDPVSTKAWLSTAETWSCPCCHRSKREIIRIANSGKLSGGVWARHEYVEELDPEEIQKRVQLLPNFTNRIFLKGAEKLLVCTDCAKVVTQVGQRFRELGECWIPFSELSNILAVAPHSAHEINWELGRELATQHADIAAALPAASALRNKAHDFWMRTEYPNFDTKAEVVADLARDLELYHSIFDQEHQNERIAWLAQHPIREQRTF